MNLSHYFLFKQTSHFQRKKSEKIYKTVFKYQQYEKLPTSFDFKTSFLINAQVDAAAWIFIFVYFSNLIRFVYVILSG